MKKIACLLVSFCLLCPTLFAQEKSPVASALREVAKERGPNLVAAAEEMPADKYGFKATPAQMTFGHLVLHTAGANYLLCSKIAGVAAPEQPKLSDTDAKEKLVERLKGSFDFCSSALAKVDDSKLDETLTLFGSWKATRAMAILEIGMDWADHYSLAATYLRLNGLLPPTAKKK